MATDQEIKDLKEKIDDKEVKNLTDWLDKDYTASEYILVESSDEFTNISIWSEDDGLTYRQMFNQGAAKEIVAIVEDDETPSSAQLAFYKANTSMFTEDQRDTLDEYLILNGDTDTLPFPPAFVLSKKEFEDKALIKINSEIKELAKVDVGSPYIATRTGNYYYFGKGKLWGSDESVSVTIYNKFKDKAQSPTSTLKISEILNVGSYIAKDEILDVVGSIGIIERVDESPVTAESLLNKKYLGYIKELVDLRDDNQLDQTITQREQEWTDDLSDAVVPLIRKSYVVKRRKSIFETLSNLSEDQTTAEQLDLADKALIDAQKNANQGIVGMGDGAEEDSAIDLEARQKIFEQCALLSDIKGLAESYLQLINKTLYSPRLYLVETNDSDSASNMNKLLLPMKDDINSFLRITPDVASMLVPKIRLFLVREVDGVTIKKEFKFPTSTTPNIESVFRGATTGKGTEFGIKSFSFSFEGTNPATARNDITADLTMFFQNFNDFISEEYDPKFVDLILYDRGKEKTAGFSAISKNQYSPDYYRILAEVGWQIPTDKSTIKEIEKRLDYKSLKNALRKTNKSFYLNMVEHDMNFKEDGTFEVKAQYRAYIESALKGPDFDALATPDILERRFERERQIGELIDDETCNTEGLQQLARAFEVEDLEMIKDSYQSIISRLLCRERIFVGRPDASDIKQFSRFGYFKKPCSWTEPPVVPSGEASEAVLAEATSTQKSTVNFFFLGDLIYTILDSAYELGDGKEFNRPFKNTNVVLFPFEIQDMEGKTIQLNIAEIPISVDFFIEWYTDNVIAVERKTYPIMNFIRDLTNKLVVDLLAEQCRYQPLENKFRFNTTTIMAKGDNPLGTLTKNGTTKLDIAKNYTAGDLPLNTDDEKDSKFSDYHNYIIIYPVYSNIQHIGNGNETVDGKRGTYHFDIGSDRGLVKKIKFSKVDMQYIREARFMQQGTQNLAQLAAVYKASIDMIGNTIYYPGMEVFINPRGLGTNMDPSSPTSVANALGFGGYHLVTRVNSNISPSSFSTNIEAMFTYSGDGSPPLTIPNANKKEEVRAIEDPQPSQACNNAIIIAESNAINLFDSDALDYENLQDITKIRSTPEDSTQVATSSPTSATTTAAAQRAEEAETQRKNIEADHLRQFNALMYAEGGWTGAAHLSTEDTGDGE
tara:strand:- start:1283 stop:4786 length:3504 start_codon:yes stop_codon:yes gene_type:complete